MLGASLGKVPNFISAQTPQGLRRAMFLNNQKLRCQLVYHNIQFVEDRWYAWFYEDQKLEQVYEALKVADGDKDS